MKRTSFYTSSTGGELMYTSPRVTDFGRIELHTYAYLGSPVEAPPEDATPSTGSGGGVGLGFIGLMGGVIAVAAGRGDNEEGPAAVVPPRDDEEKLAQK